MKKQYHDVITKITNNLHPVILHRKEKERIAIES